MVIFLYTYSSQDNMRRPHTEAVIEVDEIFEFRRRPVKQFHEIFLDLQFSIQVAIFKSSLFVILHFGLLQFDEKTSFEQTNVEHKLVIKVEMMLKAAKGSRPQ